MHLRTNSLTALVFAGLVVALAGCGSSSKNVMAPTLDTLAPTVSSTNPLDGATGMTVITASFNEEMKASTLSTGTFLLRGPGGASVVGTVTYNGSTDMARFIPSNALAAGTVYTATITTGATDLAGNALVSNHAWSFTTTAVTSGNPRGLPRVS